MLSTREQSEKYFREKNLFKKGEIFVQLAEVGDVVKFNYGTEARNLKAYGQVGLHEAFIETLGKLVKARVVFRRGSGRELFRAFPIDERGIRKHAFLDGERVFCL